MIQRLRLEQLEDRATPANLIWTGDVDNHWGTNQLGNTNWAFDLLPHNGDNLLFPASSQNHSNSNNISGLVVNSITVQYSLAIISGNDFTLNGNLTASATGSNIVFTMAITLSAGTHTVTANTAVQTQHLGEIGGPASLIKEGNGDLVFQSANSYTGLTTVNAGILFLENANAVSIIGDLLINGGRVVEDTAGSRIGDSSAVTVNSGGTLDLDGQFDIIGSLHVASGGHLNLLGSGQGNLHVSSLSLDSGALLSLQMGRPAPESDDVLLSLGPIHLGGSLDLQIGTSDLVGHAFRLIDNLANGPITGTFDGLPQGSIIDNAGRLHTIDYSGGDGNDFVLTRRPNVTVTSARVDDGAAQRSRVTSVTVTFSDPVQFSITPAAAFSLVRNSDGAAVALDATLAVINGVTVVTLNNFGGNATQFGSLADGRYTLTALASQISFANEPLDGNHDGMGGDNFTLNDFGGLYRLFGDVNGDQNVNGLDLGFFRNAFGAQTGDPNYLSFLDFNGDGVINGFDLGQFRTRFGTMLP
jgi:autotransporter-associated beta strand protein